MIYGNPRKMGLQCLDLDKSVREARLLLRSEFPSNLCAQTSGIGVQILLQSPQSRTTIDSIANTLSRTAKRQISA